MSKKSKMNWGLNSTYKEIAFYISQGKGWTESIGKAYNSPDAQSRQIYKRQFADSEDAFKKISLYVNYLLGGEEGGYVYLPKPPIPDVEDDSAAYKVKAEIFWPEHVLQQGRALEPCDSFNGKIFQKRYVPDKSPETPAEIPNKFFEVKEENTVAHGFFSDEPKKEYGQEEGNKTEVEEDITTNFLVGELKELLALTKADKKWKDSKDCLELLGRIGGQIGEKVRKESVVTTKSMAEASEEVLLATRALGMELPENVTSLFEAQRKIR